MQSEMKSEQVCVPGVVTKAVTNIEMSSGLISSTHVGLGILVLVLALLLWRLLGALRRLIR